MTLKDIADLATALTLIVATITFVLAYIEHKDRESEKLRIEQEKLRQNKQKLVENWQKVVVYRIIEEGLADFTQIKLGYLAAAQQFVTFDIPKSDIQDDALLLALMTLNKDKLISRTTEGEYVLNAISLEENKMKEFAIEEMLKRKTENMIVSKLFETLENESGKYTMDQLYRAFHAQELGWKFEDFDILIRRQFGNGGIVITTPSQKLWLRARLPSGTQSESSSQRSK